MLGEGLAAEIELYECFWGNLVIYTPTQLVGTLKALLCTRMAFPYTSVNRKSIKWTWAEPFEMNVKIEQGSDFDVDNGQRLF